MEEINTRHIFNFQFSASKIQLQRLEDIQYFVSSLHESMLQYILNINLSELSTDEASQLLNTVKLKLDF